MLAITQLKPSTSSGVRESEVLFAWVAAFADTSMGQRLVALIAEAQIDPDLATAGRERFALTARNQHCSMIERAITRGDIPKDSDVDVLMDVLYGPTYH